MFENVPIEALVAALGEHDFGTPEAVREGDRVDAIASCERLIRWAQATMAAHTAGRFEDERTVCNGTRPLDGTFIDEGVIARSVMAEIALSRQVSPAGEESHFAFSLGLVRMPHTAALFAAGTISERVARAVVSECSDTDDETKSCVDIRLEPDLATMTAKHADAAARRHVLELDPDGAAERTRSERRDRYVSARLGPHATGFLDTKLRAEDVQACWAALDRHASGLKAEGDDRTRGQLMADTLVERVTGRRTTEAPGVEVTLVMSPEALLAGEDVPAMLSGHGPISAELARDLATSSRAWLRRLFTDPVDGTVIGRDPRRRRFDGPLGALIRAADQTCRQPWCDAAVRDIDHRVPFEDGGATAWGDGDGYCERSHTVRHLPRWQVHSRDGGRTLTWTTPSGRTYTSTRPRALGHASKAARTRLQRLVATGRLGPGHQRQ